MQRERLFIGNIHNIYHFTIVGNIYNIYHITIIVIIVCMQRERLFIGTIRTHLVTSPPYHTGFSNLYTESYLLVRSSVTSTPYFITMVAQVHRRQ
jgi:hypothetical protein